MAERTTLNISITPELDRFIAAKVAAGRYLSASEVVREALRLLEEQETFRELRLSELKTQVQLGVDQIRRGEIVNGTEAIRRTRERINKGRKIKK